MAASFHWTDNRLLPEINPHQKIPHRKAVNFLKLLNPEKGIFWFLGKSSMEDRYGLYRQGSSGWTSMRNEEFQEEDVWAVLKEREDFTSQVGTSRESYAIASRRLPAAARMIPRANSNTTQEPNTIRQSSAPVNIPDWSKIYGKNSKKASKNASWLDDDDHHDDGVIMKDSWDSDDDDDDDGNVMPPHEWIAKNPARSQISSVCEGAGRTLKGRDLSRVRNAVLSKTGFLE
ncbi:hypothetical protein F0562_010095 [Nyssa sinensis]|uniref:Senescence regulator S40 n=1 Tax=Nyssa sinensis TaxID=561372 RepID=A0A5J5A1M1_9ASTE|nr:hypothetical protein F0562_010095 [Nyssa sinensis]